MATEKITIETNAEPIYPPAEPLIKPDLTVRSKKYRMLLYVVSGLVLFAFTAYLIYVLILSME